MMYVEFAPSSGPLHGSPHAGEVAVVVESLGGKRRIRFADGAELVVAAGHLTEVPSPEEVARECERLRAAHLRWLRESTWAGRHPPDGSPHTYSETSHRRGALPTTPQSE